MIDLNSPSASQSTLQIKYVKFTRKLIYRMYINPTFYELLKLRLPGFRNERLLQKNLINKPVNISPILHISFKILKKLDMRAWWTYSGVRLSRSIDLVSTSPFFLKYSRMIPGGWYLSKNLLSFIFNSKFEFINY